MARTFAKVDIRFRNSRADTMTDIGDLALATVAGAQKPRYEKALCTEGLRVSGLDRCAEFDENRWMPIQKEISTPTPPTAIRRIRSVARPLMFLTGIPEAPISTWGTCFLAGYGDRTFVVTASHLVGDMDSSSVLISPMEGSTDWLPLSNGYKLIGHEDEDPSEYDVIAYEFFRHDLPSHVMANTQILRLDSSNVLNWMPTSYVSQFFLFGFPREKNEVDYRAGDVLGSQILLAGTYDGMTDLQRTIHSVAVTNPLNLSSFAGFSGSPVLSLETRVGGPSLVRFCGIAISGTSESGRVHFVEAEVVTDLLDTIIGHAATFGHANDPTS